MAGNKAADDEGGACPSVVVHILADRRPIIHSRRQFVVSALAGVFRLKTVLPTCRRSLAERRLDRGILVARHGEDSL
jgi:hypothetical protein